MTQPLTLAQLFIWLQNETWIEECKFKFLFKSGGGSKTDQSKDRSQGIVLEMRQTSENKALLAQAAFLPNSPS